MAKSFDDNLKELIGTFVLQNLQLQTLANQLSEQKQELETKLEKFAPKEKTVKAEQKKE